MIVRPHPSAHLWVVVAAMGLVVITVVSLVPLGGSVPTPGQYDKLAHFVCYFGLGLWAAWNPWRWASWLLIVFLGSYGLSLESLQILVPPRSFSWADALANLLGAACGVGCGRFGTRKEPA